MLGLSAESLPEDWKAYSRQALPGLPAQMGTGISVILQEGMRRPEGVTLPAKILKASLYCLLIEPGTPYHGRDL